MRLKMVIASVPSFLFCIIFCVLFCISGEARNLVVGSKIFTESYILAEAFAQKIEKTNNVKVTRRVGMGGTGILYQALLAGEIDFYPEYTGTISEAILANSELKSVSQINKALKPLGLVVSQPLGFNNTYAIATTKEFAKKNNLKKISDLLNLPDSTKIAFSHEFITRADGLKPMIDRYRLDWSPKNYSAMDHSLVYEAIGKREVDLIEVYTTDAKINSLGLVVLEDDLSHFPNYEAVVLATLEFTKKYPMAWATLRQLEGEVDEELMSELNALVDIEKKSFSEAAANISGVDFSELKPYSLMSSIYQRGREHLALVFYALSFSVLIGIPLGVLAFKSRLIGQPILLFSGIVQTIPSLALLALLIPLFGIGTVPALVALCLYGLLPVVLNTFVGLKSIDPKLFEMSKALGLTPTQSLVSVEIPLASRSIIAGIKTSAIIGIGTATLAALIGAGGFGAPIVAGLAINDIPTVLTGAVPAALMALVAHGLFELLGFVFVPRGLRS